MDTQELQDQGDNGRGVLRKLRSAVSLVRLRPFDTTTPQGRSKERHRRITMSALSAMIARMANVVVMLVTVPIVLGHLGREHYGVWMTGVALQSFFALADLGMLQATLTLVAGTAGSNDRRALASYISTSFFSLSCSSVLLLLGAYATQYRVNWASLLTPDQPASQTSAVVLTFVAGSAIALPLNLAGQVRQGLQQGFIYSAWQTVAAVSNLAAVLLVVYFRGGLQAMVTATVCAQLLPAALDNIVLFGFQRPDLRPRLKQVSGAVARKFMSVAALFFVMAMSRAVGFSSDNLVLSRLLGAAAVSEYAVNQRLFAVAMVVVAFVLAPLWPAHAEAVARGDIPWVRQTLRRSIAMTLALVVPLNGLLILAGGPIVRAWTGNTIQPTYSLLIPLAVISTLVCIHGPVAMFFNGARVMGFQIVSAALMAPVNILLSIFLTYRLGIPGVAWGSILSFLTFVLLPAFLYTPRVLRRTAAAAEREAALAID